LSLTVTLYTVISVEHFGMGNIKLTHLAESSLMCRLKCWVKWKNMHNERNLNSLIHYRSCCFLI